MRPMQKGNGMSEPSVWIPLVNIRWWNDTRRCPHFNDNACATCDFDGHYRQRIEEATA